MPLATRSRPLAAAFALAVIAALSPAVAAALPSPANSTLPACIATTPGGNLLGVVIVRDLANNPINASLVVLDYSQCAGFVPCPQGGAPYDAYVVDLPSKTIRMFTGPQGQAPFYLRAGGGCSNSGIRIYAGGVFLGSRHAASADQNGDLVVDGSDVAAVTAKVGTTDLTGDMDCNNVVDAADVSIVHTIVGVNCLSPTRTARPTWGRVKTIYR